MVATERSQQSLQLAGALLLIVAGRIYLSSGGAEAMVFAAPQLRNVVDVQKLLAFAALGAAVSAAMASAGMRWVGRLASVGLGGIGGLVAVSQYNVILGAAIGLVVGLLVSCGIFLAFARTVAALAAGIVCGAAALATQRDLSGGPGIVVLLLMAATFFVAALIVFRRSRKPAPSEPLPRRLATIGRFGLLLMVIVGLWLSLSVDTVRRVDRLAGPVDFASYHSHYPGLYWFWRGYINVGALKSRRDLTDEDLSYLRGFTHLGLLDLRKTQITDDGLNQLEGLTSLGYLNLSGTKITGVGLPSLAPLVSLRSINLSNTQLTDANLDKLPVLPGLYELKLNRTKVSDAGLAHLEKQPTLQFVQIEQTSVTAEGARRFGLAMRQHMTRPQFHVFVEQ